MPWIASSLVKAFEFERTGIRADAPTSHRSRRDLGRRAAQRGILPKDSNEQYELTFWDSIKDSNYPSDYEAYLKAYPNGRFAALAHARIDRLRAAPGAIARRARVACAAGRATPQAARAGQPVQRAHRQEHPRAAAAPTPAPDAPPAPVHAVSRAKSRRAPAGGGESSSDCAACPVLIALPAGTFSMGSNSDDPAEKPVHHVSIGRPSRSANTR